MYVYEQIQDAVPTDVPEAWCLLIAAYIVELQNMLSLLVVMMFEIFKTSSEAYQSSRHLFMCKKRIVSKAYMMPSHFIIYFVYCYISEKGTVSIFSS